MPREFLSFLSRVGPEALAARAGVSINTIIGIASGRTLAGPRVADRILSAMRRYKVSILTDRGASSATASVARNLPFAKVDQYAQRFDAIVNAIARDRYIPGEGYSRAEIRGFIEEGMSITEKGISEMFEKYVG